MIGKKASVLLVLVGAVVCKAQNPIIQTKFTADPAPMVYHDTVFLYTGHDEDDATGFKMHDWLLYTSADMVNWTDRGTVASLRNFSWAPENGAWAMQVVERGGKFYMYCPVHLKGIGVLVSDSPYGPFHDPLGKPLIHESIDDIDPSVYIDEDGQAYLYWGNPNCWYVKLNPDMVSYSGDIVKVGSKPANYQEGPWFYKRNSHYYLAYASTCCPEGIGYAMSDSPTGPWVYKGMIMNGDPRSSGNHPGIIDYKGDSYVFGFNYTLNFAQTKTHRERRSVCAEKITYNADGTIRELPFWTAAGTEQIGTLNPYVRTEAETISWASGVKTAKDPEAGVFVTGIDNGDYIRVRGANFGSGAKKFEANVSAAGGGSIDIHLDSLNGALLASCRVKHTGDSRKWITGSWRVKEVIGVHDIFFVFKGANGPLFDLNWWRFISKPGHYHDGKWVGTWATAPQLVEPKNLPPDPGLSNNTLRQIVRVSLGGRRIRLRVSNAYSKDPLVIKAVSIGAAADSCEVVPSSLTKLFFDGKQGITVAPGSEVYCDPVDFSLKANSLLAITIWYGTTTNSLTGHPGSRTTSYLVEGDQTDSLVLKRAVRTDHWYSLMNIDVEPSRPSASIAIIGNSITDGRGSGTNRQDRWPDILSRRLLADGSTEHIGVLNLGIGGNCVVRGGLGPTALNRFDHDVLGQSGVRWLIVLEGINDIGGIRKAEDAPVLAKELIDAYQVMIEKAHSKGIKVYGATIMPFGKSFYDAPYRQEAWTTVNEWIRNSGKFDAVIDFDRLMEGEEPGVILSGMDDHDHLHPNEAGHKKMGEFVPLDLFKGSKE